MLLRTLSWLAVAAVALTLPSTAFAGQATTTRIETRPFYGATVTLEAGVRVFRPLPPHGHIIINPGGRTPLNLNIEGRPAYAHGHGSALTAPGGYADDGYGAYGAPIYGAYGAGHGGHARPHHPGGNARGYGLAHHRPAPPSIRPHIVPHPVRVHAPPMYHRGGGGGGKR